MSETKICPYCGEEIMAVAKKCRYCGEWLDGRNDEPAKIACPVCGEEIDADATVCPFCHEPVEGSETKDNLAVNNSTQHVGEAKTNEPDATTVNENKDGVIKTYFFDVIAHHYADFKGTMSRKEYWMYNLICVFFLSFLCIVPICFGSFAFLLFSCVFGIILFLPSLSATIRRLRDVGEEWTVLLSLFCLWWVNSFYCFICAVKAKKLRRPSNGLCSTPFLRWHL